MASASFILPIDLNKKKVLNNLLLAAKIFQKENFRRSSDKKDFKSKQGLFRIYSRVEKITYYMLYYQTKYLQNFKDIEMIAHELQLQTFLGRNELPGSFLISY